MNINNINIFHDVMLGVRSGKTDAGLMNNAVAELAANKDPALAIFPESLGETAFGLAFQNISFYSLSNAGCIMRTDISGLVKGEPQSTHTIGISIITQTSHKAFS